MRRFKFVVVAVIVILAVILVLQNTEAVKTQLIFTSVTMPRALLLAVTFLLGFAVGATVVSGKKKR
jgi:uncharacterized integral membrane protein